MINLRRVVTLKVIILKPFFFGKCRFFATRPQVQRKKTEEGIINSRNVTLIQAKNTNTALMLLNWVCLKPRESKLAYCLLFAKRPFSKALTVMVRYTLNTIATYPRKMTKTSRMFQKLLKYLSLCFLISKISSMV